MNSETIEFALGVGAVGHQERIESSSLLSPHPLREVADISDDELLLQVSSGSREALGQLFRRHRRTVLSVASRILRDVSEAEDLCQEVFLILFEKAKLFDPAKGSALSWIIQIAYQRALNRRSFLAIRPHYDALSIDEEQVSSPAKSLVIDEIHARALLNQLRGELSAEQFQTMELHFFEGYTLREISEMTRQSLGNVKHHYYRGLERIRDRVFPQKDT